jgi:hypothetical protein
MESPIQIPQEIKEELPRETIGFAAGDSDSDTGALPAPEPHDDLAGNWADDDGGYIDDQFVPNPNFSVGEAISAFSQRVISVPSAQRPRVDRLLGRTIRLNVGDAPVQFFPADPNREILVVRAQPNLPVRTIQKLFNPAAGSEFTWTVPVGHTWTLESVIARLTTSAAVANRIPRLSVTNVFEYMRATQGLVQTASQVATYYWFAGGAVVNNGATPLIVSNAPLQAGLVMPAGDILASITAGLDAADQWDNVVFAYFDQLESSASYWLGSEKSEVQTGACLEYSGQDQVEFIGYKGPVWLSVPTTRADGTTQTGGVTLSVQAVTK